MQNSRHYSRNKSFLLFYTSDLNVYKLRLDKLCGVFCINICCFYKYVAWNDETIIFRRLQQCWCLSVHFDVCILITYLQRGRDVIPHDGRAVMMSLYDAVVNGRNNSNFCRRFSPWLDHDKLTITLSLSIRCGVLRQVDRHRWNERWVSCAKLADIN